MGCGSVSLCQQLVLATAGQDEQVLFGWRSFEAYPILTAIAGAEAVQVPLADQAHDLPAMAAAITDRTRLIFVCNPNNPTGTVVPGAALVDFLDPVPADVLVVLDEAYTEFITDPDVISGLTLLDRYPNLIVLRTFSKAYGLAGLRVGYGIAADPAVAMAVGQTQVPFAVTQLAQVAALASLEDAAEKQLAERVADLVDERGRVSEALRSYGYQVPDLAGELRLAVAGTGRGRRHRRGGVRGRLRADGHHRPGLRRFRGPGHHQHRGRERPVPGRGPAVARQLARTGLRGPTPARSERGPTPARQLARPYTRAAANAGRRLPS